MESVGFKEWSIVCEALGCGRQSIILRKGGIAEGRHGFSFRHREFFLFPTSFHAARKKVQNFEHESEPGDGDRISIKFLVRVDECRVITSRLVAESLEPLHILRPEVVQERFDYDGAPGLHVALVRAFRLVPDWNFPNEKRFGGCRSWVDLPAPPRFRLEAAVDRVEHDRRRKLFFKLTDAVNGSVRPA